MPATPPVPLSPSASAALQQAPKAKVDGPQQLALEE
jgi:hypothetical protein